MNIWNKVFLGLIFLTSIAIAFLTSVEYQIRSTGHKTVATLEKNIKDTKDEMTRIYAGSAPTKSPLEKLPDEMGFDELRSTLSAWLVKRGRIWGDCIVAGAERKMILPTLPQVEAQIVVTGPFPQGARSDENFLVQFQQAFGVVYVFETFEESDEEDVDSIPTHPFLGRFIVSPNQAARWTTFFDREGNEQDGIRIPLLTVDPISEDEINQILAAGQRADAGRQSRWTIHMTPPVGRFAGISDQMTDEKHARLADEMQRRLEDPEEKLDEETWNAYQDMLERFREAPSNASTIWEQHRTLVDNMASEVFSQDFATLLDGLYRQRSGYRRDINTAKSDIEIYIAAANKSEAENAELEKDCVLEEKRLAAMDIQRDAVKTLLEQVREDNNRMTQEIEELQAEAKRYIEGIREAQLKLEELGVRR